MTWNLLASTSFAGPAATSPAIDTAGTDLLVAFFGYHGSGANSVPAFTDSAGNTWQTAEAAAGNYHAACLFYVPKPVLTSAAHTITLTNGISPYWFGVFAAWSGSAAAPLDQANGIAPSGTDTSIQPGSITPAQGGELILSGTQVYSASAPTIDSGFTIVANLAGSASYGGGLAYLEQSAAAAVNPTWSWTGACQSPCAIASFKAAAATAAYPFRRNRTWLGR